MILQIYVPLREIFQYQGITKAALRRFLGHTVFLKLVHGCSETTP